MRQARPECAVELAHSGGDSMGLTTCANRPAGTGPGGGDVLGRRYLEDILASRLRGLAGCQPGRAPA
jgi:hypothetical protein